MELQQLIQEVKPEGSEDEAVISQWVHAYNGDFKYFGQSKQVTPAKIKKALKSAGILKADEKISSGAKKKYGIKPAKAKKFKFIDLFAGIGGMRLGFQGAGGVCVFSSEYDKNAQKTYFINHGELPFGDITNINPADIPEHDVLLAGFPCQPFSHAGVSARNSIGLKHGFECNTQGTLFFDIMRIASLKRPKVLFLENVRNIERHDNGNTFRVIKNSIEELGYSFNYAIINSATEVPQRRLRCYMVCIRNDLKKTYSFPDFSGPLKPLSSILESEVDDVYTISDKLWIGHINRSKRNVDRGAGFTAYTADLTKPSNTIVARYGKDGKECLIPQEGKNPRMLTPRECAKLQGFPDDFILPTARTPAYKQFGNSVSVPVIKRIADSLVGRVL